MLVGDGRSDDTKALQAFFSRVGPSGEIIFADAGNYIISDTVLIPPGTRIVGEAWTQFVGFGIKFKDPT